ncbi:thioredoxin domain containing 15 [Mactra antiquata]
MVDVGRSWIRSNSSFVIYFVFILLMTFTFCGCDQQILQQKEKGNVDLLEKEEKTAAVKEDVLLTDSTLNEKVVSKVTADSDACHIDGSCNPDANTKTINTLEIQGNVEDRKETSNVQDIDMTDSDSNNDEKKHEEVESVEDSIQAESTEETLTNATADGNNSSVYQWIKFLLDPIIEEFKDGIYPKVTEKPNSTESNVSVSNDNTSVLVESSNETVVQLNNVTESESNQTETGKKTKFECTGRNVTDNSNATVKLITTAKLLQLLNFDKNDTDNVTDCLLVMFYAPWCHFCAKIAPHYNALARAFPQLDFVAVDTAQFSNLLARFGTVSVPNILVFHDQSRAAVKFNQTDRTFENFVTFVTNSTGLQANTTVNVTEIDYLGPVPSVPTNEPDYLLLISWIFVIFCSSYMFIKSNKGQQWINKVRTLWVLWQEHQHID